MRGHAWEQAILPWASRDGLLLNLGNTGPIAACRQVVVIHDAAMFSRPEGYSRVFRSANRLIQRTLVRTTAQIRRVFTYNAQHALIVRATADQMALTEKLIHDLDKPKSEVVIDVIVMQVNSQYSRSLAATIASGGTAGIQQAITFNGPNGAAAATPAGG